MSKYNVRIWKTSDKNNNISFPELSDDMTYKETDPLSKKSIAFVKKPNTNGVSIAFAAGGARSLTSNIGYTRALIKLGHFKNIQYIGTCSGGSWFTGLFLYARSCCDSSLCGGTCSSSGPNYIKDEIILGESCGLDLKGQINPEAINMYELENKNKENLRWIGIMSTQGAPLSSLLSNILNGKVSIDRSWSYILQENILKFYNLNKNKPIAASFNQAENIRMNNPNIFTERPYFLRNDSPFWLCSSTLFFNYYSYEYPYIHVTLTPMYSGIPQVLNIEYRDTDGSVKINRIGGHVMDNFAFGNLSINDTDKQILDNKLLISNSTLIKLNKLQDFKLLSDTISVSSATFGSTFLKPEVVGNAIKYFIPSQLQTFLTNYYIWGTLPQIATTRDSQCSYNLFSNSCETPNGYDSRTCSKYLTSCYSNTAPQCKSNRDCVFNTSFTSSCKNRNSTQSNLNCYFNPTWNSLCSCNTKGSMPYVPSSSKNFNQKAQLSDGNFTDPFGLLPLLARQVKKIIVFDNHSIKDDIKDPIKRCVNWNPYFGKYHEGCDIYFLDKDSSRVFIEEKYEEKILNPLLERAQSTGPLFIRFQLPVSDNKLNGIKGTLYNSDEPYIVDILYIVNDICEEFYNSLQQEVKKEITNFSSFDPKAGKLNKFPEYTLFFQNYDSLSNYSIEQTNMLSTYTEWIVMHRDIKPQIDNMFEE